MVISVYKKFWSMTVNTLDMVLLCKVVAKDKISQYITYEFLQNINSESLFPTRLFSGREFNRSLKFVLLRYKIFVYMSL